MVCALSELAARADVAAEFGGKAAGLARLIAAGLPVPPGFAVSRKAFDGAHAHLDRPLPGPRADERLASAALDLARQTPPERLADLLTRRARELGEPLIVRSSATIEDVVGAAAPGIFTSITGVRADGVARAVARVWASALAPAAWAYLHARGRDPAALAMGVVVQPQLAGRFFGVAYTKSPRGGDAIDIEVEGGASGDPTWARVAREGGRVELGPGCPLARDQAKHIADLAIAGEAAIAAGAAGADIEWVLAPDALWLVQARPLPAAPKTAPSAPPASIFAELSRRDADAIWRWDATHNPEPLSPAQIGLVERVDSLDELPVRLAVAGGYLYTAPAGSPARPPPVERFREVYDRHILPAAESALAAAEAPGADVDDCLRGYDDLCRVYFAELSPAVSAARRALPALLAELGYPEPEELAGELVADASRSDADELGERAARGPSDRAAVARELAPLSPVWDVAAATYGERPGGIEALLDELLQSRRAIDPRAERERAERRAEELCRELRGDDAGRLSRALAAARAAAAIAEIDDRLFFRAQAAVRRALLEIGRRWRLDDEGDVFWVPLDEVADRARRGDPPDAGDVRRRAERARERFRAQREWTMPLAVAGGRPITPPHRGTEGYYRGRGTEGRARGRALRLGDRLPSPEAARDRIVVALAITPASVLAIRGAAGIVAEHGGALGHAAALARELAIPCVVGCRGIAAAIADGDALFVDADEGVVLRLS